MSNENKEHSDEEDNTLQDINIEEGSDRYFRKLSILSYFVVLVLLGIPVWWYTTRVYRAPLPLEQISQFEPHTRKLTEYGIPMSLEYDVLISFVHPEPAALNVKINVLDIDAYLQNFLKISVPVFDFTIKSQWLYLTELGAVPTKVGDHFALSDSQLPHIITPLETKLWSHLSPRPSINLVVYFPHCRSPLYIYDSNNKILSTNAFISPRWGGIYIVNVDKNSCELGNFEPDVRIIGSTFKQMLLELFKMNNESAAAVQSLQRQKIVEMVETSKKTLKSLAQLLSEINSIVISDDVADKINVAVQSILSAEQYLKDNDYGKALLDAKLAFKNSEEAFADPSLLALLYFPDDQKYAIYIPLFLPVMIPVIISLMQITKKVSKPKRK